MTIEISLTKGYVAIVDNEDADLALLKWSARESGNKIYAQRMIWVNGRYKIQQMHRVILGRKIGRALEQYELVDHIHGNSLDNRRSELRVVTSQQNARNVRSHRDNTSGFKGVFLFKDTQRWYATIGVNGKRIYLGSFNTPKEAAIAYNHAAREYHGEFACYNDVPGWETSIVIRTNKFHMKRGARQKKTTSGFRGISPNGRGWSATIMVNSKRIYLGTFKTPEEAHEAYKSAAIKYLGERVVLEP